MIRTPYLVLFIFLGAIAVGTASALITITLAGDVVIEGDLDMTNGKISNLVTPSVPADAATKAYVDSAPGTDTLALLGCTTDQIARWTGTEWTCSLINSSPGPISIDRGGFGSSLTVVNGKPAISYTSLFNDLAYFQANNVDGTAWNTPVIVDTIGGNQNSSLEVVNGKPAISYTDLSNENLRYVQASDVNGNSWNTPLTLGSALGFQSETSLVVVNGKPAISYQNVTTTVAIKYIQALDADGTACNTPITIANGGAISLAVVNGKPAISYIDTQLKYIQALDADGTTWNTPVIVENTLNLVQTSLVVVNGKPAISYIVNNGVGLKYVQSSDADGTAWNTPVTIDSEDISTQGNSLAVVNGKPAISYIKDNSMKYVQASDADGTTWNTPVKVDAQDRPGDAPSLAVVNGRPAISYVDDNTNPFDDLIYVIARDADGTNWSAGISFE